MQMRLKIEGNNNKSSANKIASAKWMKVLECQWRKFLKKLAVACEAGTEREKDSAQRGKRVAEMLQVPHCAQ